MKGALNLPDKRSTMWLVVLVRPSDLFVAHFAAKLIEAGMSVLNTTTRMPPELTQNSGFAERTQVGKHFGMDVS